MAQNPIQWFPGHMAKAQREIEEKLKLVDIVLELIDARIPVSSVNPVFERILQNKKKLVIMTKVKMADSNFNTEWKSYYESLGINVLLVDSISGLNVNKIANLCKEVLKEKIEKDKARGLKERPLRTMVLGIPNVGKSTLINKLCGKNIALAANKPGVTKSQQWIRINKDLDLLDTPGVLWPKFEDINIGYNLALTGAIKDDIVRKDDMILYFLEFLVKNYPNSFKTYNLEIEDINNKLTNNESNYENPYVNILDMIALKKGFIRNGNFEYERCYALLLNDFRNLNLGTITLERPNK